MQYAEKCSQPYDFQICIIHLFLQGKLNNCSCSWSFLCISSLSCSALLLCWEPHREQTPLLWQLMEAWLWKFCLFGFFPLICDSFSPFITQEEMGICPYAAVFSQEKPLTWAYREFSFLCPGKCSHSLGMRLPLSWRKEIAGFSMVKSRTVKQSPPSSLTCAAQLQGHGAAQNLQSRIAAGALLSAPLPPLHAGQFLQGNSPQDSLEFGSERPFLSIKV